LISDQALDH